MSLDEKMELVKRENDVGKTEVLLKRYVKQSIKEMKEETELEFPLGCNTKLRDETTTCGDISFGNKIILCDDCTQKLIEKFEKINKRMVEIFGKGLI